MEQLERNDVHTQFYLEMLRGEENQKNYSFIYEDKSEVKGGMKINGR